MPTISGLSRLQKDCFRLHQQRCYIHCNLELDPGIHLRVFHRSCRSDSSSCPVQQLSFFSLEFDGLSPTVLFSFLSFSQPSFFHFFPPLTRPFSLYHQQTTPWLNHNQLHRITLLQHPTRRLSLAISHKLLPSTPLMPATKVRNEQ